MPTPGTTTIMDANLLTKLKSRISGYTNPKKRKAFSTKHPSLSPYIVYTRRFLRTVKNYSTLGLPLSKGEYLPHVIARHSSPLYRALKGTDFQSDKNKVSNLKIAIAQLDKIVIPPGKTFSLWHHVGITNAKKGYMEGMVISNGAVSKAVGGGLCQLSNFLFWILMHCDVKIIERYSREFCML